MESGNLKEDYVARKPKKPSRQKRDNPQPRCLTWALENALPPSEQMLKLVSKPMTPPSAPRSPN